jgi:hypothetical protein
MHKNLKKTKPNGKFARYKARLSSFYGQYVYSQAYFSSQFAQVFLISAFLVSEK